MIYTVWRPQLLDLQTRMFILWHLCISDVDFQLLTSGLTYEDVRPAVKERSSVQAKSLVAHVLSITCNANSALLAVENTPSPRSNSF